MPQLHDDTFLIWRCDLQCILISGRRDLVYSVGPESLKFVQIDGSKSVSVHAHAIRPKPDQVLLDIADYVIGHEIASDLAYETARHCLIDTLGCGLEALEYPACTKLLGPIVPGTIVPNGAKVPGTPFQLDPIQAAFNLGAMIRWLGFNDTWLAAEQRHPSDNLGGILAVGDWLARQAIAAGRQPPVMRDVLTAMIKPHEIQGVLALE